MREGDVKVDALKDGADLDIYLTSNGAAVGSTGMVEGMLIVDKTLRR